jgi:hypothetical protein
MKSSIKVLALSSLLLVSIIPLVKSQEKQNNFNSDIALFDKNLRDGNSTMALPESSVNIRAVRSFRKSFPNVDKAKWKEQNGYYFVSFTTGSVKQKVVYNRNGEVDYALKIYSEKELPSDLRAAVKGIYYDYAINSAQELKIGSKIVYLVQISTAQNLKTVRICEGDMEEIEDLIKN